MTLLIFGVVGFEISHYGRYRHFLPIGLHADALAMDGDIGIPGRNKLYWAEITNLSFWPVTLTACNYVTDAMERGTEYPYAVRRWDEATQGWRTIAQVGAEEFCRPVPLSTIETHAVPRWLWPGLSVRVMEWEATGARAAFRKWDRARFVVFTRMESAPDWKSAVASRAFIEDDVKHSESGPFRVNH